VLDRLIFRLLLTTSLCLGCVAYAADNETVSREYQLKTVYLFHFAELAEWPSPAPVTICLQGDSPLRAYLPILEGLQINNQAVRVKVGENSDTADCQILFLTDLAQLSKPLLDRAKSQHILLVSDVEDFAARGGMVQFTLRDNKLKLVVNLPAVKSAGLKLSSKLLRMAEIVE
jgi:hypothetical protein